MRERSDYLGRDGYTWWFGEVEDNEDPSGLGRLKVRILGWYTGHQDSQAYLKELPTEVLPWAQVLLPTDKPQTKGAGTTSELKPGAWVLGFFLDGDEAQLPIVLGALRGFQRKEGGEDSGDDDKASSNPTTVADATVATKDANQTASPQRKTMTGQEKFDGHPFPKNQTKTPADPTGANMEQTRGVISAGEEMTPGNATTNPTKPPVEKQSIPNGVAGPTGQGFKDDVTRMLSELGQEAAGLATGAKGQAYSILTGMKVAGDKVMEHMGKIMNFLAGGISGIMAPLKEFLAKLIAEIVNAIVKIISQFIPLIVIQTILAFLDSIFDLFCAKKPMWLGLVQAAISDVSAFANNIASQIVSKIQDILSDITAQVEGVVNRVLEGIGEAMDRVKQIAADVVSAIETATEAAEIASRIGNAVQMIFSIDFTSLDWSSLIGIIKMILGLLFQRNCNRTIKQPKSKAWFPLIGTTECDNIEDAVKGSPYANFQDGLDAGGKSGSYIDKMFTGMNQLLAQTETFLNGAKVINDATPGVEKQIHQGPGGVTTFQDSFGNEHKNVPNNETKIIAKDKCETIKGNYVLTVEGDFYLKVMGNYHEEITGAKNENKSQGPQAESSGSSKQPNKNKALDDQGAKAAAKLGKSSTQIDKQGASTSADIQSRQQSASDSNSSSDMAKLIHVKQKEKDQFFKYINDLGGFYPVDKIPFHPEADHMGRTPWGSQLAGELQDETEQRSGTRMEGDHDINYAGEVRIQGAKVKLTGIEAVQINAQTIKLEANTIENTADGEIINEANWITSFLNTGRFEMIALFNPFSALSGQFTFVNGCIIDITADLPFPGAAPPTQTRMALGTTMPPSMNDVLLGSVAAAHTTFIATPTGVISEFVPTGSILNQVAAGLINYSVGTGYMAVGCGLGPNQVYGLPLLLN
jgi:hypothetical protein